MLVKDDIGAIEEEQRLAAKYKHVRLAADERISEVEASRLADISDNDILYVLALNKSPHITREVLMKALENADVSTVKNRIRKRLEV